MRHSERSEESSIFVAKNNGFFATLRMTGWVVVRLAALAQAINNEIT